MDFVQTQKKFKEKAFANPTFFNKFTLFENVEDQKDY